MLPVGLDRGSGQAIGMGGGVADLALHEDGLQGSSGRYAWAVVATVLFTATRLEAADSPRHRQTDPMDTDACPVDAMA